VACGAGQGRAVAGGLWSRAGRAVGRGQQTYYAVQGSTGGCGVRTYHAVPCCAVLQATSEMAAMGPKEWQMLEDLVSQQEVKEGGGGASTKGMRMCMHPC
jgi:hypothetical protein